MESLLFEVLVFLVSFFCTLIVILSLITIFDLLENHPILWVVLFYLCTVDNASNNVKTTNQIIAKQTVKKETLAPVNIKKLTSMEFTKSCNAQNIVKLIPSMEERIVMIDKAATNISLSIPVNPCLILSMIWKESTFKKNQKSHKKAKGLLQVLPSTEKEVISKMGYELNKMISLNLNSKLSGKELQEIAVGAYYMNTLVKKFNNDDLAIMAYNEGASRIMKRIAKGQSVGANHNYLKSVKKNLIAMQ